MSAGGREGVERWNRGGGLEVCLRFSMMNYVFGCFWWCRSEGGGGSDLSIRFDDNVWQYASNCIGVMLSPRVGVMLGGSLFKQEMFELHSGCPALHRLSV